eukprot:1194693-Prorocentrum_minimum.AAC.2
MHPRSSIFAHFSTYTREGFRRALKVYLPVHVLPLLIFHPKSVFRDPLATGLKTTEGIVRSSLFLATFCSLGWLGLAVAIPLIQLLNPNPLTPSGQHASAVAGGFTQIDTLYDTNGKPCPSTA